MVQSKIDFADFLYNHITMATIINAINTLSIQDLNTIGDLALKKLLADKIKELKQSEKSDKLQNKTDQKLRNKKLKVLLTRQHKLYVGLPKEVLKSFKTNWKKSKAANIKEQKKIAKGQFNLLTSLGKETFKNIKNELPKKAKNLSFQKFCKWNKVEGITSDDLKSMGGKREWNKQEWAKLSKEQKNDPNSPWM